MSGLYDRDFYAWANEQAALLREGRFDAVDLENVAEEIESLARREKRDLRSRITALLTHRLMWEQLPVRRGRNWLLRISMQRNEVQDLIDDSPSLISLLPELVADAYEIALLRAQQASGLRESAFPKTCPWTFEEAMAEPVDDGDA